MWFWDLGRKLSISSRFTFKLAGKNWFEGVLGPLVFNIVVRYWCKRKMLKRNWNWRNNRLFCHIFVIGEILTGWEARLAKPMLQLRKTKKLFPNFPRGFRRFPTKFPRKIVLSSSRGQVNFRGPKASRPRTSNCVLEDVLEAKDVLEDSTSGNKACN